MNRPKLLFMFLSGNSKASFVKLTWSALLIVILYENMKRNEMERKEYLI